MAATATSQPPPEVGLITSSSVPGGTYAEKLKPKSCPYQSIPLKPITYLHEVPQVIWEHDEVNQMIVNENLEYAVIEEETSMAIAWISFPALPPNIFGKEAVFTLAAAVGKPLQVDMATKNQTRPSCTRVKEEGKKKAENQSKKDINVKDTQVRGEDMRRGDGFVETRHKNWGGGKNKEPQRVWNRVGIVTDNKFNLLNTGDQEQIHNQEKEQQREEEISKECGHTKDMPLEIQGSPPTKQLHNDIEGTFVAESINNAGLVTKSKDVRGRISEGRESEINSRHMFISENGEARVNRYEEGEILKGPDLIEDEEEVIQHKKETEEDEDMDYKIQQISKVGDLSPRHTNSLKYGARKALMEPFQNPSELEQYKRRLGFDKAGVNQNGKIWCFWKDDWVGNIVLDTVQQVTFQFKKNDKEFMILAVYARCNAVERLELWEELDSIEEHVQCPWIIGGDFNVILDEKEKVGGLDFTINEAIDFASFISRNALSEVHFSGSKYTWWNSRIEEACIFKRLDRILVNQEFLDVFPASEVHHLIRQGSDHAPLHLSCNSVEVPIIKPFRFMNFWSRHQQFKKIVEDSWKIDFVGNPFFEFHSKLKNVKKALSAWSKEIFGNVFQQIATLEDIIKVREAQLQIHPSADNRAALSKVEAGLKNYLRLEEEFWRQKAGMKWFKEGGMNTKIFHSYV
ncbi:hypothetical protein KY289_014311 [Solanum tuberosum]|nr:hypothetical protein KY289_014311 [Solanum tuberosum]KAH0699431.1 hypothetical protein KY284_013646 [Solanum tuberosum]